MIALQCWAEGLEDRLTSQESWPGQSLETLGMEVLAWNINTLGRNSSGKWGSFLGLVLPENAWLDWRSFLWFPQQDCWLDGFWRTPTRMEACPNRSVTATTILQLVMFKFIAQTPMGQGGRITNKIILPSIKIPGWPQKSAKRNPSEEQTPESSKQLSL